MKAYKHLSFGWLKKDIKARVDDSIRDGLPLLDGRVIGIANATADIEDALFRRFLHIVVEDVMMVNKPEPKLQKANAKPCPLENVQVQQEKIMSRLERIETKFKRRKLRRMKNRI